MKFFEASVETIIIRYYVMMAVVIIPFVIGIPILAVVALPIFLSALMGISFKRTRNKSVSSERTDKWPSREIPVIKSAAA